jgi:hypothetical protein
MKDSRPFLRLYCIFDVTTHRNTTRTVRASCVPDSKGAELTPTQRGEARSSGIPRTFMIPPSFPLTVTLEVRKSDFCKLFQRRRDCLHVLTLCRASSSSLWNCSGFVGLRVAAPIIIRGHRPDNRALKFLPGSATALLR